MLQKQQQENEQTAITNPLEVEFQRGRNQEQAARLPGIQADVRGKQLEVDQIERTREQHIDELLSGYKGKMSANELAQITRAGEAYNQVSGYLKNLPPAVAPAAAKQMLGSYWRPEFDGMDPQTLVKTLGDAGMMMTSAQTKYQQAMQKQDDQQAAREKEILLKANKAQELAKFKESIKKVVKATVKAGKVAENYRAMSAQIMRQAQLEQDPDKRAILMEQAQEFTDFYFAELDRKAQAAAATKPDPGALGFEKPPVVPIPTVKAAGSTPAPAPAPAAPVNNPAMKDPNLAKLPPGTKALGNGIYQLPSGRKVQANK